MSVLCVLLLRLSPAQGLDSLDIRLFRTINNAQNHQRNGLFEHLDNTSLPSFVAAPVLFMTLGLLQHAPKVFGTGAIMGSAEVVSLAATAVLKPLIGRPRPFETLEDVKVKHKWSTLGASFPSGHSASAFAVATVLSLRYPHAPVIGASSVWAILVACGRVYLGCTIPRMFWQEPPWDRASDS